MKNKSITFNPILSIAESDILNGIMKKDHTMFTRIYGQYFLKFTSITEKVVKDRHVAEDIVQNTFLKLWEIEIGFYKMSELNAYLYRSVINGAINYLNHQKSRDKHQKIVDRSALDLYADTFMEHKELQTKIFDLVEDLPNQCSIVFKMSRYEGLKYREIAYKLGLSERTVENHIALALKVLRRQLLAVRQDAVLITNTSDDEKIYNS